MTSVPHFQPLQDSEERNRGKGEGKRERDMANHTALHCAVRQYIY